MPLSIEMCMVSRCLEVGAAKVLITYFDDALLVIIIKYRDVVPTTDFPDDFAYLSEPRTVYVPRGYVCYACLGTLLMDIVDHQLQRVSEHGQ